MIKFLKNQDIQVSNFAVANDKTSNTLFLDLLLANDENYEFPLILLLEQPNYNFNASDVSGSFATISPTCKYSVINQNGYLASSPNVTDQNPDFRIGKKYTSNLPFYSSSSLQYDSEINPQNNDGTYKGQVYNTIKKMYYNNYNNSYNMFGIDGYDNSKVKFDLSDQFISYTFHLTQSGDRIRPNSVNINNQTGDIVTYIKDDGNNNLYLSGSYFVNKFDMYTNNQNNVKFNKDNGLSKYLYYTNLSS